MNAERTCNKCSSTYPIEYFSLCNGGKNRRGTCRKCRGLNLVPKYKFTTAQDKLPKYKASMLDIAWAAGIWEGEGSIFPANGKHLRVTVCQKDPEILHKLRDTFGGVVRSQVNYPSEISTWYIYSDRAHGFIQTIFTFLSGRRREQVKKALEVCYRG